MVWKEASDAIAEDGDGMRAANLHQLDRAGRGYLDPPDQPFRNLLIPKLINEFHMITAESSKFRNFEFRN
jgi:hypothetical protein